GRGGECDRQDGATGGGGRGAGSRGGNRATRTLGFLPRPAGTRDTGVVRFRPAIVAGRRISAAPGTAGGPRSLAGRLRFPLQLRQFVGGRADARALHRARRTGAPELVRAGRHWFSLRPVAPL